MLPVALDRFLPLGLEVLSPTISVVLENPGGPCRPFRLGCQQWAGEIARPD